MIRVESSFHASINCWASIGDRRSTNCIAKRNLSRNYRAHYWVYLFIHPMAMTVKSELVLSCLDQSLTFLFPSLNDEWLRSVILACKTLQIGMLLDLQLESLFWLMELRIAFIMYYRQDWGKRTWNCGSEFEDARIISAGVWYRFESMQKIGSVANCNCNAATFIASLIILMRSLLWSNI